MLIGILGNKRHDKDTIADYLVKNYNFNKMSFIDPLKQCCKILFGFDDDQLYGDKKEVLDDYWKVTPRKVLQFIGTDLVRNQMNKIIPSLNDDLWVEIAKQKNIK